MAFFGQKLLAFLPFYAGPGKHRLCRYSILEMYLIFSTFRDKFTLGNHKSYDFRKDF